MDESRPCCSALAEHKLLGANGEVALSSQRRRPQGPSTPTPGPDTIDFVTGDVGEGAATRGGGGFRVECCLSLEIRPLQSLMHFQERVMGKREVGKDRDRESYRKTDTERESERDKQTGRDIETDGDRHRGECV